MCRLTAYLGPPILVDDLLYRSERSVIKQSFDARERLGGNGGEVYEFGNLNADGFGLGWYPNATTKALYKYRPCVFRDTGPAWLNQNLGNLSTTIESRLVFAHVRAAGPGMAVCQCSCHPFVYGRYMFMHNGQIAGFSHIRRYLMSHMGDIAYNFAIDNTCSDSAVAFALFIDQLEDPFQELSPSLLREKMITVIETICIACEKKNVTSSSLLNFVLTDGVSIVASRYVCSYSQCVKSPAATLYFASGSGFEAKENGQGNVESTSESFRMVRQDRRDKVAIVTSEPLTNRSRADWIPVPSNHIVLITSEAQILISPVIIHSETAHSLYRQLSRESAQRIANSVSNPPLGAPSLNLLEKSDSQNDENVESTSAFYFLSATGEEQNSAVLSMVSCCGYLHSSGLGKIYSWDLIGWQCFAVTEVHTSSILALCADEDKSLLFSSCSDNFVHIWCTSRLTQDKRLQCLRTIKFPPVGHILDLKLISSRLFTGSQDAVLRCIEGVFESSGLSTVFVSEHEEEVKNIQHIKCCKLMSTKISSCDIEMHARSHFGYIYAIEKCGGYICSAGGDGQIKLWDSETMVLVAKLEGHNKSVLTLAADENRKILFSGSTDRSIRVWDLSMKACRRAMLCHDDVLCMTLLHLEADSVLLSGLANGKIIVWSCTTFDKLHLLLNESGSSICNITAFENSIVCAGTSSGSIVAWRAIEIEKAIKKGSGPWPQSNFIDAINCKEIEMLEALRLFVSIPSVSGEAAYREDCWAAGRFLCALLSRCGFKVNTRTASKCLGLPVIVAELEANALDANETDSTIIFYGHYDVVPVANDSWDTNPWELKCIDGYLYSRGISDNKGPIIAAIFASKELNDMGKLRKNFILVLEGEEESGTGINQRGFSSVIEDNAHLFKSPEAIVISNNYWIDDKRPCLTYGMRGVIDFKITISGPESNLHAGVDGGPVHEPLENLVWLVDDLSTNFQEYMAPGVHALSDDESKRLEAVDLDLVAYSHKIGVKSLKYASSSAVLQSRWSKPSLSISSISSSNNSNTFRKIPSQAEAKLSLHFVPNQNATKQKEMLVAYIENQFKSLASSNSLKLEICQVSDWWLGNVEDRTYAVAADAIYDVWKQKPLYVREGGSYGGITSFLERTLSAPAIHLPMGQSSDNAHLANERISLKCLMNGKQVLQNFIKSL